MTPAGPHQAQRVHEVVVDLLQALEDREEHDEEDDDDEREGGELLSGSPLRL